MADFSDFDFAVQEFMDEMGFYGTYVRTTGKSVNDDTGKITLTTEDIEIQAIRMELVQPANGTGGKFGTLIQNADLMLFVRPTEKTDIFAEILVSDPTTDRVIINGIKWSVVTVKVYSPDATSNILYELYLKK